MKVKTMRFGRIVLAMLLSIMLVPVVAFAALHAPGAAMAGEEAAIAPEDYGTPGTDYVEGVVIACVKGGQAALQAALDAQGGEASLQGELPAISASETLMQLDLGIEAQEAAASGEDVAAEDLEACLLADDADDSQACSLVLVECDDVPQTIEFLQGLACVVYAQPDYVNRLLDDDVDLSAALAEDGDGASGSRPSDPMYTYQWGLNKDGTGAEADIGVETAWEAGAGAPAEGDEQVVAVLDSGVDYSHPDLAGVMWDKGLDYPALTALGGGKYGLNTESSSIQPSTDPMDTLVGHGTHCASVIASQWNDQGTAGVGRSVKIMALRGLSSTTEVIKNYNYLLTAKEHGVNVYVVSNSWGAPDISVRAMPAYNSIVNEAGAKGIVSVFAAGNESVDHDAHPYANVTSPYDISVGALTPSNTAASFSDYGRTSVDVFAPGVQILAATSLQSAVSSARGGMTAMYLPWAQPAEDSYFYEDFGSADSPKVTLTALRSTDGGQSWTNVDDATFEVVDEGYAGSKGGKLSFGSGPAEGEAFAIEISIPKNQLEDVALRSAPFLAFEGSVNGLSFKHDSYEGVSFLYYQDDEGEWVRPMSYDGGVIYYNPGNSPWYVFSNRLENARFLNTAEGEDNVKFLLRDVVSVEEGASFTISNVGLGKKSSGYYYANGTSMACPMVSGVASLVANELRPTDSAGALKVAAYVKGSVTPTASVENLCVTGGVVSADGAYDALVTGSEENLCPVIDTVTEAFQGKRLVIKGSFFGEPGFVEFGGARLEDDAIISWTDSQIEIAKPADITNQLYEVKVTRSDERSGHAFVSLKATAADGFVELPDPSNLSYTNDFLPRSISADTFHPAASATTEDSFVYCGLAYYFYDTSDTCFAVRALQYSYEDEKWDWAQIDLSDAFFDGNNESLFSMAGGKTEIYLKYPTLRGNSTGFYLVTYNTQQRAVTSKVDITEICGQDDQLLLYGDDLLLFGDNGDHATPKAAAMKIYPDTGRVAGAFEVPEEYTSFRSAQLRASGSNIVAAGALDSEEAKYDAECQELAIYDGAQWVKSEKAFFGYGGESAYLEPGLTSYCAAVATDSGAVIIGPVGKDSYLTESQVDTWVYDAASDEYAPVDTALFEGYRSADLSAVAHEGSIYAISLDAGTGKVRFRAIALDALGAGNAQDAMDDAAKDPGGLYASMGGTVLEDGGFYLINAEGALTTEGAGADNYNVSRAGSTVTLNNAKFNGIDAFKVARGAAGIVLCGEATLNLVGKNEIVLKPHEGTTAAWHRASAILACGNLTITGSGSLSAASASSATRSCGMRALGDVAMNGTGTVSLSGADLYFAYTEDLYDAEEVESEGMRVAGDLLVNSGTLTATGGSVDVSQTDADMLAALSCGLRGPSAVNVKAGALQMFAADVAGPGRVESYGMDDVGECAMRGGSLEASHGDVSSEFGLSARAYSLCRPIDFSDKDVFRAWYGVDKAAAEAAGAHDARDLAIDKNLGKGYVKAKKLYTKVAAPAVKTKSFVYDGTKHTCVKAGEGYIVKSGAKMNAGTYTAVVSLKSGYMWKDGSLEAKTYDWKVTKATNPMVLKAQQKTLSHKTLKSKSQTFSIVQKKLAVGTVTYTVSAKVKAAGVSVSKKGVVTVKKGIKAGRYTIKVKASGNGNYKSRTRTFTIYVK